MSPDTSTCTETHRLVDVHGYTFSEKSPSLNGPSLVSTNDVPEAAIDDVACPSKQCALEDIFPETRDTESKRGDKVDHLLRCGLLYGKGSKQPIQLKRREHLAKSPELHGAVEQHRVAADRQQSGSKRSRTLSNMSIALLGAIDSTFTLEQRGLGVSLLGNVATRFEHSNQYEHRSPGRDGTFAMEHRGLGVSPLERGFQARAC
ncbi:hypothetical protein MRX96_028188 [Rhipicephalus microplus]